MSVPTIDTFGCARFHPFGNGKPQKRAGPATRERRKPWRRQAPPFPESVQVCKFFQMTLALAHAAKAFNLERALNAECGVQSDVSRGGYGLTLAEIDLMWKTAPPRMPIAAPAT